VETFRNYLPCFPAPTLATEGDTTMPDKGRVTLPGIVESIQKPRFPDTEKADIVLGVDNFYQEIVIENTLTKKNGEEIHLKPGAEVKVTIEAGPKGFRPEK
jgi:hypothetical protein